MAETRTQHRIARLGHQGDGIAEGPVFAARTLPGEAVSGILQGNHLGDIRVETPSDMRVSAPCRHFKACGGCQLQHAADEFLAGWKQDVVKAALSAIGLRDVDFRPIHTSAPQTRRRAKFAARRTKKGAMAGFHAKGTDVIVEIPDCQLLQPDLKAALPLAEDLAQLGTSRKQSLSVQVTTSRHGLDVAVSGGKASDGPLRIALADAAARHDLARLVWDDEMIVQRRRPEQDFDGVTVLPPPGAFLQATRDGENALRRDVQRNLAGAGRLLDLFAGCGTFALPLARQASVHAVEGDQAMTDALDDGWRHAEGLRAVTSEARDLFRNPLIDEELARFDGIVIDPPRAGAEAQIAQIATAQVPMVAYVSCNPTSFARDARTLVAAGYILQSVMVVDQFRWSAHVELSAQFRRN